MRTDENRFVYDDDGFNGSFFDFGNSMSIWQRIRRWYQPFILTVFAIVAVSIAVERCTVNVEPINRPYSAEAAGENILFTAFTQRSPRHLDPAKSYTTDETPFTYSIYEPLYGYHYLQRPYQLVPRAASHIAEPSYVDAQGQPLPDDAPGEAIAESIYDIPIQAGIMYQPHPAFARDEQGGYVYWPLADGALEGLYAIPDFAQMGTRALTAADYEYGIKRLASPRVASPIYTTMAEHIVGMESFNKTLNEHNKTLPRDAWLDLREFPLEGVQALDDHTLRIRIKGKYPQFKYWLAMTFTAPIPWEADRFYHQPGMAEHNLSLNTWPVGTGPYMLTESILNRRHVLSRNPYFRGEPYPCEGEAADQANGLLQDCGAPTPFIDQVVFTLEKESVPLMGKFLQGYYDIPQIERSEYGVAMLVAAEDSADKAELYQERALKLDTSLEAQVFYMGFNMADPVVGHGDTPEQAERNRALRQAISIAIDWEEYATLFQDGQAEAAHSPLPPGVVGYEPLPEGYNPVVYERQGERIQRRDLDQAKALLAEAGYPNGRDQQTGAPLILYFDWTGGMGASALIDWFRRQLRAIDVQLEVRATDFNRFQEKLEQGSAQLFLLGWVADYPDAENFLFQFYGPKAKMLSGGENSANYQSAEFDALFDRLRYLDDGPEKTGVIHQMVALLQNDAPWMFGYYPKSGSAVQSWVHNAKPTQMVRNTLQYLRLDPVQRVQRQQQWNAPILWPLWVGAGVLVVTAVGIWRWLRRREHQRQAVVLSSKGL